MAHKLSTLIIITLLITICSCSSNDNTKKRLEENNILKEWTGPYGGVPQFDKMNIADLKPAMERALELKLEEIEKIANNPDAPTFDNTILAMEKAGKEYNRVLPFYRVWRFNLSNTESRKVLTELAPKVSAFKSKIIQNDKLFRRVKSVYEDSKENPLPTDKQRLVLLIYEKFALNGAELDNKSKTRYAAINEELSVLHTSFRNNVLADEEKYVMFLDSNQLTGLPESLVSEAAKAATDQGKEGLYAITNTRSFIEPFLTYSDERELRKQAWTNYYSRGGNRDENDNNENIKKILTLRDERVSLMGYENYAQWKLQNSMAKNAESAMNMMEGVWPVAVARVKKEVVEMQNFADTNGDNITIEPWDYRYYQEKLRKEKYDLNSDEVKQYLQFDKLQEAMFFVAGELFNFNFKPVSEAIVPVFHKNVKVWEVTDITSGEHIGLWYLDPYARKGKGSGAWDTTFRTYSTVNGKQTVICSSNLNFVKPNPGEPLLINWEDAKVFFQTFGHLSRYLNSSLSYPTLNGEVTDYSEFQSLLLKFWLTSDKVINNYMVHHETGERIPQELIEKIKKADINGQGFETTEYLGSALLDMHYHTMDPKKIDPVTFEIETLADLGLPKELSMRYRSTHFNHIFSGEHHAAGYYGYMWADVLTADAVQAFRVAKDGFYNRELAEKLKKYILAPRNSVSPAEAYRKFRGRDARIDAFMQERGFTVKN